MTSRENPSKNILTIVRQTKTRRVWSILSPENFNLAENGSLSTLVPWFLVPLGLEQMRHKWKEGKEKEKLFPGELHQRAKLRIAEE